MSFYVTVLSQLLVSFPPIGRQLFIIQCSIVRTLFVVTDFCVEFVVAKKIFLALSAFELRASH